MSKSKALPLLFMLLASIFALTDAHAEEAKVETVEIVLGASNPDSGVFYNPTEARVETGTTVRWINTDKDPHTVTDGTPSSKWGGVFDSGFMRESDVFAHTFTQPGNYPYLCALHPWMYGKVIVEDSTESEDTSIGTEEASVKTGAVKIVEKLGVFIRSERQTFSEDEVAKFGVDILAGNKLIDPDSIKALVITVGSNNPEEQPEPADVERLDLGKYSVSLTGLEPASYNLSVKASKDGFESGYSMLTVHVMEKESVEELLPEIYLEVDRSRHSAGDAITILGEVLNPIKTNTMVVLRALDPDNRLYTRGQEELKLDGTFEWTFKVAGGASEGKWTVRADYMEGSAEASFEIERPVVSAEPEPEHEIGGSPTAIPKNEKVSITGSIVTDQMRSELSAVQTGQQAVIQSEIRNNLEMQQTFVYILQVKDSDGIVVKLEMVEGVLPASKSFSVGIAWMPDSEGEFFAEVFVWKSLEEPVPLSPSTQKLEIGVKG